MEMTSSEASDESYRVPSHTVDPESSSESDAGNSSNPEVEPRNTKKKKQPVVEGAVCEGGRGPSIWDTFSHTPGKTADGKNGDKAVDQYYRFKEDVDLMANLGWDAYRFSISWSRIFPDGCGASVNGEGIQYYDHLINCLLEKGIRPCVTLFHWDLPQKLQDDVEGWLSSETA
ncbi:hypothetical protein L7F22_063604 [Adiantum nelumboides]|nr:hypothetical protein [Adiantum nelumboides]